MTFLKKLGGIIAQVSGIFLGFAPFLTKEVPGTGNVVQIVSKDLAAIADAVTNAEAIGQLQGLSGADKAKALGPIVAQIIMSGTLVANKKIGDQAGFLAACTTIGGGVADLLNAIHQDSVQTVTTAVPK